MLDENSFGQRNSVEEVEEGDKLQPKFDEKEDLSQLLLSTMILKIY